MAKSPVLPQMKPGKHTDRHIAEHREVLDMDSALPGPSEAAKANAKAQMLKARKSTQPDQFGYRTDSKGNVTEDGEE